MVKSITIIKLWRKVYPGYEENKCQGSDEEMVFTAELVKLMNHVESCEDIDTENSEC